MREEIKNEDRIVAFLAGEPEVNDASVASDSKEFHELEKTWELTGIAYSYKNSDPDQAWEKLSSEVGQEAKKHSLKRMNWLQYAAVFIGLVSLGSLLFYYTRPNEITDKQMVAAIPVMMEIKTTSNPAVFTTVVLPDGSTVKINASSTLQYPKQFSAASRKVKLTGEAYFDVVHDASHPFVVEVNNLEIEDVGTSFNISAYPGKGNIEVNVTTGSVKLRQKDLKEEAILVAGSKGTCLNQGGKIEVSNALTPNYLSWITKAVTFHRTPLSTVFEDLENIYHVRIEYTDPRIATIPYTANFEKFQLDDIVSVIAKTHHLSVSKQADGFVFALK
jgi:ferric-dicitrate binding protein FerR (iron transport regulator)